MPIQTTTTPTGRTLPPDLFLCPLTREIFHDPVVASDGISYERSAIEAKHKKEAKGAGTAKDESTRKEKLKASSSVLCPNRALLQIIKNYHRSIKTERTERHGRESGSGTTEVLRTKLVGMERGLRRSISTLRSKSSLLGSKELRRSLNDAFYCPITFALMQHPVIDVEGNTFDRKAIKHWIKTNHTSPITRNPLFSIHDLYPNTVIRHLLEQEATTTDKLGELELSPSLEDWKNCTKKRMTKNKVPR